MEESLTGFLSAFKKPSYSIFNKIFFIFYQEVIFKSLSNIFGLLRDTWQLWWLSTMFSDPLKLINRENDPQNTVYLGCLGGSMG